MRQHAILAALFIPLLGCTPIIDDGTSDDSAMEELAGVPATIWVNGRPYDVETQYLPRVVQCENSGAPIESLKAQAIAARTYLTYKSLGSARPTIEDGESDQVFTCASNQRGAFVSDAVQRAVATTKGLTVRWRGKVIAGFYVAGARRTSTCARGIDPTETERFVTINHGLTGDAVKKTRLGSSRDARNRGAMGQLLANCLATRDGLTAPQLLAHFYGADITIGREPAPSSVAQEDDPALTPAEGADDKDCWSPTLQRWVEEGACVESAADGTWFQCVAVDGWTRGVNEQLRTGPLGECTEWQPQ